MNIMAALIVTSMNVLEATPWSRVDNAMFHTVFGSYGWAFIGIIIACYTAQVVDITLYLWIKKITRGKWLWLRNNGSTAVSLFVDTFIAIHFLTFLGLFPKEQMWLIILNSYSYKLTATILNTPVFYVMVGTIRRFIIKTPQGLHHAPA